MKLTPINLAEAIFEPFWDPRLSGLAEWQVEPGAAHGLEVEQNWCWVTLNWARRPADGLVLRMRRHFGLACGGYDRLLISINLPPGAVLTVRAVTDRGRLELQTPPSTGAKVEHPLDLAGAQRIDEITLEVRTALEGSASGWINWLGLQNSATLERLLAEYQRFTPAWEGYLKPPEQPLTFVPAFGLLINAAELPHMRAEFQAHRSARPGWEPPFLAAAREAQSLTPEAMIHDYVNFWGDTRYCRQRDEGHLLLRRGPDAAIAGLLLQDPALLRPGPRLLRHLGRRLHLLLPWQHLRPPLFCPIPLRLRDRAGARPGGGMFHRPGP
jgi:hypothetical protein